MKPFAKGTEVQILFSAGDHPAEWTNATVVEVVRPNMRGFGQSGNVVRVNATQKRLTVTEPGMIRPNDD